jgi:RsiW-degrading membrane proteinase PrsW (M82 family)
MTAIRVGILAMMAMCAPAVATAQQAPVFEERAIAKAVEAESAVLKRRGDSIWNGFLIGAGAGFAATEIWTYRMCGANDTECAAIVRSVGWLTMVPGGAVVGALIDKAVGQKLVHNGDAALALAPVVAPRMQAVVGTISFGAPRSRSPL